MKKLKFVFCFILLTFIYIVGGNVNNIYAYTTINSQTLFTPSTFDTLVLNYTTLPTVSVSGSQAYHLGEGTTSSGAPTRGVYYDNASTGQTLDSTVTVNFSNCGTLLGRPIDMKLIYSDIVTNGDGPYLYWSAFGSQMMSSNEWWYQHIEHVDVDVYFYYHGETTPINIDTAYLSIFSEDTNEGSGSSQISEAYLYTTTNMAHVDNRTSVNGSRVYYDVYYGTTSGSTEAGSLNCVSFRYNNKDHLNIELYGLNYGTSIGYHLQYTPLTAVVPSNPVKTVSKTQAQLGDTLTYTVEQQISTRFDDSFHYSSLVFTDIIDKNLTYNSLRVYNENGNDVTSSAGTTSYDSTTQRLTYTFNSGYLQNNMNYNGQSYKFVISANVKHSVNSAIINNSSSVNINNQHELNSNTVTTTLKSKVNVHYVNMQGVKIAEDEVINGNILDPYSTSSKNINGYKLIRDTGNTQGTMTENEINVTYTYDIVRSSIQIDKTIEETDSTQKQNLAGAVFKAEVINFAQGVELAQPDTVYYSTQTDENGHCVIDGLPYGTYKITESTVPDIAYNGKFYLNDGTDVINTFNVEISQESSYEYSIEDVAKKMQIVIYKEDSETGSATQGDAKLEGAEYTIYRDEQCSDAIETVTIQKDAQGKYSATSGWYMSGTYYVKETKAPEGYLIDNTVYPVVQVPSEQTEEFSTHTVVSKDEVIRNDIEIVKNIEETDSTQKQSLAGAIFSATLNSDTSKVYYSTETDESGYCIIEDLPYGTYTVRESTIPDTAYNGEFYIGNSQDRVTTFEQFIEVDDGENAPYRYGDITDVAKKMQIVIYKEDSETGNTTQGDAKLEGAEYTIYRDEQCSDAVETVTIAKNDDGTYSATSGWYMVGTYYVKETKAPEGYNIDEKVYPVVQVPSEQTGEFSTHTVVSKDEVIRNDIEIVKNIEETDSTQKQSLAGAIFSATLNSDTSKVYYSTETDESGYCIIEDLPYGTYTVRESTIPDTAYNGEFYIGNSQDRVTTFEQFIEVDDGENAPYRYGDITDVAKKMQIVIYKEDSETGNTTQGDAKLEGAEYTIYRDEQCSDAVETVTIAKNDDGTYSATSGWYMVGTYYVKETKAPEGYLIDEKVYPVVQVPSEQTEEFSTHTVVSKDEVIRNDIEIVKNIEETDSTQKQSLAGAIFSATLNSDTSKVYYSTETDESGYCIIEDLPYGTYTVRESTIPDTAYNGEFYIGNSQDRVTTFEQFIEVDDGENAPYRYGDITDVAKKMQIVIYKEDSETGNTTQGDAKLEGAEYTIYRDEQCSDAVETVTIAKNDDGTYSATSGWYMVGTYYVKETKAPEGYLIDEKVYPVVQVPSEQTEEFSTHTVVSKDEVIRNDIEIVKNIEETDSTQKQSLAGAVFSATLNSDTSKVYYSTETDESGYCIIEDLPYGTYTVRESTIPDTAYNGEFYIGNSQDRVTTFEQFIEVDDGENAPYRYGDITDVAKKMQIVIYKEDSETGNTTQGDAKLEGAEYTIYRDEQCSDAVETVTIAKNDDGTYSATSGWYMVGTYYVKETKAPEGYLIDEKVYPVVQVPSEQTEEFSTHTVVSKDEVIRNDIEIVKNIEETDSTQKQSLAGAVFSATLNSDTSKVYYSTETDESGYCIIEDLPYGTYTVRESTIPDTAYNGEFYIGNSQDRVTTFEQFIEVDDGENAPYRYGDITDVAKKMQIVIYKEDSETGNTTQGDAKLEGAEYTIYRDEQCSDAVETVTIAKNDDGTYSATSGWYMVGTYYVKETKAPEGYLIDEKVYPVVQVPSEQKEEFSTHTVLSKDKVIEGIVKVIKYNNSSSSTDEGPATGAVLRLTLNSNEDIYYEATVNEYGYLEFVDDSCKDTCYPYTIPYGKYTISEVKASDSGAHVFIEEQPTEIVYDKQIQEYILSDEYVRMSLTIEKYDGETGNKIPTGATFKIWDVNNNKWYEEMSYPSGEYISEFTTNSTGSLTLNRHLEAGRYILYETKAPEGYYLDDDLREGSAGYEFTVQVNKAGDVVVTHNGEEQVLEYEMVDYDNVPTKMYKYTAKVNDIPQKAIVEVEKLADQVVGVQEQDTEYGKLNVLQYDKKGLENVTFQLVAAEDIVTPDGTTRYNKGQVVSNITTNNQGIGRSQEVYLGKYLLKETSTQNGYVLNSDPIEINIQYTNQYEKVQIVKQKVENKKQEVNLEFEKIYKQLEESKFKFDETFAVFGVYTKTPMYGYDGSIALGENQLVDILETDENNMLKNNVELPEGEYYVKELYVSNPYGLEDDTYEFKVEYTNTDNQPIEVTVNNGKIENIAQTAELEMIKFSDADYEKLNIEEINDKEKIRILASEYGVEGAVYKVYNDKECTNPVITIDNKEAEFITDENGTIKLSDMPYGTYYFKEVEAPYGYELSDEIIEVKINDENSNLGVFIVVNDPLKKADLLQKIDTFTKDVVSGCEFEIYNDDGRMIYSAKTDNNGKVQIPIIYFENGGKYYYKEVSAPKMYQVDEEAKEFIAEYDEEKCEWTLELIEVGNDRKTIDRVILRKTDRETGEPLQGCEFTIVLLDENGEEYVNQYGEKIYLVEKGVTNEEGEYVIKDVPYGTYRFVEIKAPEGYELDEDITGLEFTVDEKSGDTLIFEVTNTGDIAVVAIASIAVVSVIGIIYVLKRKKVNSIM